jgi:hypothetical protein
MGNIVGFIVHSHMYQKNDPAPFVSYIMYVSQNLEYMIWKEGFKEQFVQLGIFILGHYVELAALFCPF